MGPGIDEEIQAFLRLKLHPGLGDRRIAKLVHRFGSGTAALRASAGQGDFFNREEEPPSGAGWAGRGVRVVPMTASEYPFRLLELSDPPPLLFFKGESLFLRAPAVAVVGARKATESGRAMAETIGRALGKAGFNVVSGMARGVDGAAHRGALSVGGATTAVLGSGLDVVYPPVHRKLFSDLEKRGLLLSEFLPGERALPHHFPRRNRIIAALAHAIIVVEAGARSGALITVDHGLDLGREILAVPGSPWKTQSLGTNALILEGARLVRDPERILDDLPNALVEAALQSRGGMASGLSCDHSDPPIRWGEAGLPEGLQPLLESLHREPKSADLVAEEVGLALAEVLAGLSALEMLGLARRCSGMRFRRE